jgi:hypothetical protein
MDFLPRKARWICPPSRERLILSRQSVGEHWGGFLAVLKRRHRYSYHRTVRSGKFPLRNGEDFLFMTQHIIENKLGRFPVHMGKSTRTMRTR